jgi:hypothetical protein
MLKQVGAALQASDSVHSHEAVEAAKRVSDECKLVFDEIEQLVGNVRGVQNGTIGPSLQQRFSWVFKKGRVSYLMAQLESLKLNLSLLLQILQLGKSMAATSKRYVRLRCIINGQADNRA